MCKWRKINTTCTVKGTDVLNAELEQCFAVCQSGNETRRASVSRRVVLKNADT